MLNWEKRKVVLKWSLECLHSSTSIIISVDHENSATIDSDAPYQLEASIRENEIECQNNGEMCLGNKRSIQ